MTTPYLTITSDHLSFEFTKEQFLLLMEENGIQCQYCNYWNRPKNLGETDGRCEGISAFGGAFHDAGTQADDFCSRFKPKTNG